MLTVITGPMFSGKTSELIRRLECARIAGQRALVLRPAIDRRFEEEDLRNHCGHVLKGFVVRRVPQEVSLDEIGCYLPEDKAFDVVGIDEAQFLDRTWAHAARRLSDRGLEVIVAGLNQDFRGDPFGEMPRYLSWADRIVHLRAVCTACGGKDSATRTWRKSATGKQISIGGGREYEPLCPSCWSVRWAATRERRAVGV